MIQKLEKLRESEAWNLSKIYTYLKRIHIFVKFLVYPVTFFYFLFFNYTSVYFLNMFTNVKMKKALKDLATAHFTKNMLKVRGNIQILIFSYKICIFALKHISITNQEIMWGILFVSPFGIKTYVKFSVPFNNASIVEETEHH